MKDISAQQRAVDRLLDQQDFHPEELDYAIVKKEAALLQELSSIGNSAISIFDMCKREHVFYSSNFGSLFGYDIRQIEQYGTHFLADKIHPDDTDALTKNGISILKLFFRFSPGERTSYKFINEYRILKADQTYVRVVEQDQILHSDAHGNMWLSLGIIDIAPNQQLNEGLKSQVFNFKTGRIIPFPDETAEQQPEVSLSPREKEVLQMVKNGWLSKEISDKLSISIHTVNTHRQRILEKLHVNNSIEAVSLASRLGLI